MPAMTVTEFGMVLLAMSQEARKRADIATNFPNAAVTAPILNGLANTLMIGAEKCIEIGEENQRG